MPTRSDTYRVLIASPADLTEEREAATDAVYEWNTEHATAESVVLLPITWENQTHRQEIGGDYLLSPKRNANAARNPFYKTMREVAPGELIFSFVNTRIVAIGIGASYHYEFGHWNELENSRPARSGASPESGPGTHGPAKHASLDEILHPSLVGKYVDQAFTKDPQERPSEDNRRRLPEYIGITSDSV